MSCSEERLSGHIKEDIARKKPSTSSRERLQEKPKLLTPSS
jgi:hypothetical protein